MGCRQEADTSWNFSFPLPPATYPAQLRLTTGATSARDRAGVEAISRAITRASSRDCELLLLRSITGIICPDAPLDQTAPGQQWKVPDTGPPESSVPLNEPRVRPPFNTTVGFITA